VTGDSTGALTTLEALLADPAVTTIFVSAGGAVKVERRGSLEPAGELGEANAVAEAVWQVASLAQPPPPPDNPVVDVRLGDGTRVTALFPPIVPAGATATIRKAALPEIALGAIAGSKDVEDILAAALESRRNLLLAGDAPSIASLAGAIAGAIPADRRVVSIGAGVKSRPGWVELTASADPAALARAATAFRGDHLLVAEIGGSELSDLLTAASRGQEGLCAAVAARSAAEALTRLRALSVGALGGAAFPAIVTSTVDLVVVAASGTDGQVTVSEIAEPRAEGDALGATAVARRPEGKRGQAPLEVLGVSSRLAGAIAAGGGTLPPHLVRY
jgi:pilus assembly protein CpaF